MSWTSSVFCRRSCAIGFPTLPTKQRPRMTRGGHVYTPAATETAEQAIRAAWIQENGLVHAGFDGPVRISIDVWRQTPRTLRLRDVGREDINKPDLDNTAKLILDALNGCAWSDDKQVVSLCISRHRKQMRGSSAGIEIEVQYLAEHES